MARRKSPTKRTPSNRTSAAKSSAGAPLRNGKPCGPAPSQEALLEKLQRQFDRLDSQLDSLEVEMIRTGWMPDPVEEKKAARAAAKAARMASDLEPGDEELQPTANDLEEAAADEGPLPHRPRKPR